MSKDTVGVAAAPCTPVTTQGVPLQNLWGPHGFPPGLWARSVGRSQGPAQGGWWAGSWAPVGREEKPSSVPAVTGTYLSSQCFKSSCGTLTGTDGDGMLWP